MKLEEFSLWAFKLPLNESRIFTLFIRSVCAHFERHFNSIQTDNVYRVIIKISEDDERFGKIEESSSVLKYYKNFNFDSYNKMDDESKKRLLLDFLYNSLLELCDELKWPKDNFKCAYNMVLQESFVNHYCLFKKMNRNRKMVAELICHHDSDAFKCYLEVRDKSGIEIFSKLLFSEVPDEYIFNGRIGRIKWLTSDILIHHKKDKTELERFQFNEEGVTIL